MGLLTLTLALGMTFAACDAPAGPQGPLGPEGTQGPVGPAGEDGSVIYSDAGTPAGDIGDAGDYYLDQDTGELYGPKDSDGWGSPIIVLMGDDGQDGADGQDGSQIHSGSGAPDASLGVEGDYYLDEDSYGLYGPKTSSGWGSPLNLKGADGNANVTRYIFPGHDFEADYMYTFYIDGIESEEEMRQNVWMVYLVNGIDTYIHIPGDVRACCGLTNRYRVSHEWASPFVRIIIALTDGNGDQYNNVEVIRIGVANTEDHTKRIKESSIIPDFLNVSNYDEVAEYYGFGGK